ncbi:LysR family transcriptional regulator [Yoonia sediminilitoris]|uniref:LysR family transcriptional regulator n=1 Tax=Yoonia sediminilitoris TaxID=1286148 RepID=A0A2T6KG80_9RHOB|nr:LysR family transcriptional regulator [Yoonia sediminilitoris]PUB14323.1 LysR family transcriptional regulator [Yoonia sediminilitoris]RCW95254.1 LysR family transcriptional regulator [Yoonia sediminilitoris]
MNVKGMRAFIYTVEEGSLNAAAVRMNLSQPAVSRLIQILEEQVDAKLFYRNRKSLSPTREASLLYPEALKIISAIDDFPTQFDRMRTNTLAPLQVFSQARAANSIVLPAISMFAQMFPNIKINLEIVPRRELRKSVIEHRIDVAVHVAPFPVSGMILHEAARFPLFVLLHRDHPLATRQSITIAELQAERYIALKRGLMVRELIDQELAKTGQQLAVFHQASGMDAAQQLVAARLGYTFCDTTAILPHLRDHLVLVPCSSNMNIDLGIYCPSESESDPHEATLAFMDCIKSIISDIRSRD